MGGIVPGYEVAIGSAGEAEPYTPVATNDNISKGHHAAMAGTGAPIPMSAPPDPDYEPVYMYEPN